MSKFSGLLIFFSFIFSLYAYFFNGKLLLISGLLAWIAVLLLFNTLKNKKMIFILFFFSFFSFCFLYLNDYLIDYERIFTVNQYLLSLLIGVGFLRLIASPKKDKNSSLPKGEQSFLKTYLGVHLFGSVINLSALILVADKFYKKAKLSKLQIILLTRAFASDAYWSPFFVAFAAALTYAPKLQTSIILINGLFLALMAFLFTYFEIKKKKEFDLGNFRGYPLSFDSLYLPLVLALLVLITNYIFPHIKVIVLISLFSLLLVLCVLPIKKGLIKAKEKFIDHLFEELPKMKLEASLFLVAGMFGVLISSILVALEVQVPFERFDWIIASILLLIFIFLAFIGIHPIITIAIIGDFMGGFDNTLLAITFLMAWSTTVSTSPFSGLNLTIQARYEIKAIEIFKLNIFYVLKMYILSVLCLFFISKYLSL